MRLTVPKYLVSHHGAISLGVENMKWVTQLACAVVGMSLAYSSTLASPPPRSFDDTVGSKISAESIINYCARHETMFKSCESDTKAEIRRLRIAWGSEGTTDVNRTRMLALVAERTEKGDVVWSSVSAAYFLPWTLSDIEKNVSRVPSDTYTSTVHSGNSSTTCTTTVSGTVSNTYCY